MPEAEVDHPGDRGFFVRLVSGDLVLKDRDTVLAVRESELG